MENSYTPPFPPTIANPTISMMLPNKGVHQNSDFSLYDEESMSLQNLSSLPRAPQFVPPNYQMFQTPQVVYPFWQRQNGNEFGVLADSVHGSNVVQREPDEGSMEKQRRTPDWYRTKVARIRRRLARQRSLSLQRNGSSLGSSSSNQVDEKRLISFGIDNSCDVNNTQRDHLYKFCTPDYKRLKVLLRKELKNSDVGSLGRIVLPKREAELNLPTLSDKEGIHLLLKDVNSNQFWTFKYKFWSNNKSRMYVLENTGEFVRQNGLEIGDDLILYEDENKNLPYFSMTKVGRVTEEPSINRYFDNEIMNSSDDHVYMPFTNQSRDVEETTLELLIEQLEHKEQQESSNLMISLLNTNSQISANTFQTSSNSVLGKMKSPDEIIQINFEDCYGGLDMLPGFHNYNFSN